MRSLSTPSGHDVGRCVAAAATDCSDDSSALFVALYVVRYPISSPVLVAAVVLLSMPPVRVKLASADFVLQQHHRKHHGRLCRNPVGFSACCWIAIERHSADHMFLVHQQHLEQQHVQNQNRVV
jgi:hypothetical protein